MPNPEFDAIPRAARHPPMNTPQGEELEGRLFADLSTLNREHPITPVNRFYIRTRASHLLPSKSSWSIRVTGPHHAKKLSGSGSVRSGRQGIHLLECSGNPHGAHFGMISTASWQGAPLASLLDRIAGSRENGARLLISGFDTYATPSVSSIPGASWIFSLDDLYMSGGFLAPHGRENTTSVSEQPVRASARGDWITATIGEPCSSPILREPILRKQSG